jgi:hypothetical protein
VSPPLPVDLSRRPDLQDLYVKPHDGSVYDRLADPEKGEDDDDDTER